VAQGRTTAAMVTRRHRVLSFTTARSAASTTWLKPLTRVPSAFTAQLGGPFVAEDVERGQVCAKPGSITPHTKFKAEVYCLKKEEGGRHTPFFSGYRPQFYFRTTDVTGVAHLPEGTEMVMPGDNVQMEIELIQPIAMDQGLRFAIREGGRTVGSGIVTEVIQ